MQKLKNLIFDELEQKKLKINEKNVKNVTAQLDIYKSKKTQKESDRKQ